MLEDVRSNDRLGQSVTRSPGATKQRGSATGQPARRRTALRGKGCKAAVVQQARSPALRAAQCRRTKKTQASAPRQHSPQNRGSSLRPERAQPRNPEQCEEARALRDEHHVARVHPNPSSKPLPGARPAARNSLQDGSTALPKKKALTFDMSGGVKAAKQALARPLDGMVRAERNSKPWRNARGRAAAARSGVWALYPRVPRCAASSNAG